MISQKFYQKPNGQHINDRTAYVMFDFGGERVEAFSFDAKGEKRAGALWSYRDAENLVASGHWECITERMNADLPRSPTDLEGGAW